MALTKAEFNERLYRELLKNDLFELLDTQTLIIGLGGTGLRWAANTRKLLTGGRYKLDEINRRVQYLFIDSDPDTFGLYDENTIPKSDKHLLSNISLQEYLRKIPEEVSPWFNREVPVTEVTDGAGQIRMAGRCLFFENIPDIRRLISDKLNYFQGQATQRTARTNVFILSGLCGGTGSGSFIDIAYLVKRTLEEIGNPNPMLYGVFELPDSTIKRIPKTKPGGKEDYNRWRLQNNGYTALQELDYFMKKKADDKKTPYRFTYRGEPNVIENKTGVFNKVYLLSNDVKTKLGGFLSKNPKDPKRDARDDTPPPFYYVDRAVPELINTFISKPCFQNPDEERNHTAFLSNASNDEMLTPNINKGTVYSTLGVAKLEIPADEILTCVVNRFFFEFKSRWSANPTEGEVQALYDFTDIEGFHATADGCLDEVIRNLSKEELQSTEPYIRGIVKDRLRQKIKDSGSNAEWIGRLKDHMEALYKASGPFSMINLTKRTCDKIDIYVNSLSFVPGNFEGELGIYKNAKVIGKGKAKKDLLSAIRNALEGEKNLIFKEFITGRRNELVRYNNETYTPCTGLIENLSKVLNEVTHTNTETMRVPDCGGETFSWDFSQVDYAAVSKKTAAMFRKIVVSNETVRDPHVSFEDLYRLEGTGKGKKVFNYNKDTHGGLEIDVISESNKLYHKVSEIRDEIVIGGRPQEGIDFDGIAKEMLDEMVTIISGKNRRDLLGVLFAHIKDVCKQIVETAFETLLLSSAKGYGFSEKLTPDPDAPGDAAILPEEKKKIYDRALDDFYFYSGPSLPFRDAAMPDQTSINVASLTISPEFTDPDFIEIYNKKNDATRAGTCTIKGSPLLLNLRLFTNLTLMNYHHLPELSKAKKKLEESDYPVYAKGVHLAEGEGVEPEWNWNFMPGLISKEEA